MTTDSAPALPTNAPAPAAAPAMEPVMGGGLSHQQHLESVEFGLSRGFIDRAKAEAILKEAGNPLALPEAAAPAATENAAELPPGFEGGKISDYQLPNLSDLNEITGAGLDGTP